MRSSIVFASALLAGALARPHVYDRPQKRDVVTELNVEVITVVVTVTAGFEEPTAVSSATFVAATSSPKVESSTSSQGPVSTPVHQAENPDSDEYHALPVDMSSSSSATPIPSSTPPASSGTPPPPSTPPAPSSTPPAPQPSIPADAHISGPNQSNFSSGPDYKAAMLFHHNAARANHGAQPLVWDDACEANARIAAEKCIWAHYIPDGAGQGQNIFAVSGDVFNATAGVREAWYNRELTPMLPYFGKEDIPKDVFEKVGHLTQIVWDDTTKIGCVSLDCGDKMMMNGNPTTLNKFTVCNYSPPGNWFGGFADHVALPFSITNLGGWAD